MTIVQPTQGGRLEVHVSREGRRRSSRAFALRAALAVVAPLAALALTESDARAADPPPAPAPGGASPGPSGDSSSSPAPPPSGAAPSAAAPPSTDDSNEMVFHGARNADLDTMAAGSMRQMRLGPAHGRYAFNIFGDVDFFTGNDESAKIPGFPAGGSHPSFSLGTLSFLITGELENHFVSTAELAFEVNDQNAIDVDIERLQVGWHTEHFFVYAGRVHTALGYWSNAYHHGKWLQPTMERPRWVAFEDEGGLLPIHSVGLNAGAIADIGAGQLKVTASVSNGRGLVVDDVRNTVDFQDGKAVHAQIEYIGLGLPDLRVGIAGMVDRIPPADMTVRPARPDVPIDEYILGAHIAYPSYPVIFIAEGYFVAHRVSGDLFRTFGGFVTLGRAFGVVTPYVRGQWIGTQGGRDPFFVPQPSLPGSPIEELEGLVGLRVDLTDWTALRAEYRATKLGDDNHLSHLGVVQWCWGF